MHCNRAVTFLQRRPFYMDFARISKIIKLNRQKWLTFGMLHTNTENKTHKRDSVWFQSIPVPHLLRGRSDDQVLVHYPSGLSWELIRPRHTRDESRLPFLHRKWDRASVHILIRLVGLKGGLLWYRQRVILIISMDHFGMLECQELGFDHNAQFYELQNQSQHHQ